MERGGVIFIQYNGGEGYGSGKKGQKIIKK